MSKYRKPLNIFTVLEDRMVSAGTFGGTAKAIAYIKELDSKYDLNEIKSLDDAERIMSKEDIEKAYAVKNFDRDKNQHTNAFNIDYKNSLRKLFKEHGLPVHINAFDIHRMNIDIENIDNLIELHRNNEGFRTIDFFTDDNVPAFATAPYPLVFVQLENLETFRSSIGKLIGASNSENSSDILDVVKETGVSEEEIVEGLSADCETYMLVQSYGIDDYVGHLHMYSDNHKGAYVNDTLRTALDIDGKMSNLIMENDSDFTQEKANHRSRRFISHRTG